MNKLILLFQVSSCSVINLLINWLTRPSLTSCLIIRIIICSSSSLCAKPIVLLLMDHSPDWRLLQVTLGLHSFPARKLYNILCGAREVPLVTFCDCCCTSIPQHLITESAIVSRDWKGWLPAGFCANTCLRIGLYLSYGYIYNNYFEVFYVSIM